MGKTWKARSRTALLVGAVLAFFGPPRADAADYALPKDVKEVKIASSINTPPFEYYDKDGSTVLGYEPDLLNEAAKRLSVKLVWSSTDFAQIFTGIDSGRYDMGAFGIIDKPTREQTYDILSYMNDFASVAGKAGAAAITDPKKFCGTSMVMVQGYTYEDYWKDFSAKTCVAGGLKAIEELVVKDDAAAQLVLKTDRAQYFPDSALALVALAKADQSIEVAKSIKYLLTPLGLVFPKGSKIAPAFQAAFQEMMNDGAYLKILKKWGIEDLGIKEARINAIVRAKAQ